MIIEYILMSLRDLWRRKGRTILTSLGITIGTLLIVTMVGLGTGVENFMYGIVNDQDSARNISVSPMKYMTDDEKDSIDYSEIQDYLKVITDDFIKKVEATNLTETVVGSISGTTDKIKLSGKEYAGAVEFIGYNEGANIYTDSEVKKVRTEKDDDSLEPIKSGNKIKESSGEVLIGEAMLEQIELSPADVLNKEIEISVSNDQTKQDVKKKFKIVGVIDKNFSNSGKIVMTAEDSAELRGYQTLEKDYLNNNGYDFALVYANDISDVEELSQKINDLDYMSTSSVDMAKEVEESLGAINTAFTVLGVIVLVVAAIGIVNTMTMSVMERTKSIGVMKSVGASNTAIRTMFLVQASLIGLIGGGVGILGGIALDKIVEIIARFLIRKQEINADISMGLPWYSVLVVLAFSMGIALISGIYPANKAGKLDPIEALRR